MKRLCYFSLIMLFYIIGSASMRTEIYDFDGENERFVKLMDSIRHNVSDSTLVEYVVSMDFYKEPTSSSEEYAYYFCYCVDHKLEEYDEGISWNLYKVFTEYPQKFQELGKYLVYLLPEQEVMVKEHLCYSVAYDWIYNRTDYPRFEDFLEAYPFFNEPRLIDLYKHIYQNCLSDFAYRKSA